MLKTAGSKSVLTIRELEDHDGWEILRRRPRIELKCNRILKAACFKCHQVLKYFDPIFEQFQEYSMLSLTPVTTASLSFSHVPLSSQQ